MADLLDDDDDLSRSNDRLVVIVSVVTSIIALVVGVVHATVKSALIDSTTLGLLGFAALPWVGYYIKSFKGFGIEFESSRARLIKRGQRNAQNLVAAARTERSVPGVDTYKTLANEYNEIRNKTGPSSARTSKMTEIVGKMINLATDNTNPPKYAQLHDEDGGERLYATAYFFAHPDPNALHDMIDVLTTQKIPRFEQFWLLNAISKTLQTRATGLSSDDLDRLYEYCGGLPLDSGRLAVLSKTLKRYRGSSL